MANLHVSFVLDESGSMSAIKDETITGFNEYLETLAKEKNSNKVRFSLAKFSGRSVIEIYKSLKLSNVPPLDNNNYTPSGTTPLYDAVGKTIISLEEKLAKKKKQRVLIVIQTDGYENTSQEFKQQQLATLIEKKRALGWGFIFFGADQDAWLTSQGLGISRMNTMSYESANTVDTYGTVASASATFMRSGGTQVDNLLPNQDEDSSGGQS